MKKGFVLLALVVALMLVAAGCAKPPTEAIAKAEAAVAAAKANGANENCPDKYAAAEAKLALAKSQLEEKDTWEEAEANANETVMLANIAKGCPPPPPPATPEPTPPPVVSMKMKAIHFDYDRYNIRPDAAALLKTHAPKMKDKMYVLEGHCDERGTAEYNLALGDRRAKSAKNYLISLGVGMKYLKTVSFGEAKPVDPAHNETAWAKNRRVEFKKQ